MKSGRVDVTPVTAHVNYLQGEGLTQIYIGEQAGGITRGRISQISRGIYQTISEQDAEAIMSVTVPEGHVKPEVRELTREDLALRAANNRKKRARIKDQQAGNPRYVSVQPVRDHIAYLRSRGMNSKDISVHSGILQNTVIHAESIAVSFVSSRVSKAILGVRPPWSSIGLARRLQGLSADGFSRDILSHELGMTKASICSIQTTRRNRTELGELIVSGYNSLSGKNPEDYGATPGQISYSRKRARLSGYAPTMCWDEDTIDDPDAWPEWTGGCGTSKGSWLHTSHDIKVMEPDRRGSVREFAICRACRGYARKRDREKGTRVARGLEPLTRHILTPEERLEVLRLLDGGWSQRQVGRKFEVSQQVIWNTAKKARDASEVA